MEGRITGDPIQGSGLHPQSTGSFLRVMKGFMWSDLRILFSRLKTVGECTGIDRPSEYTPSWRRQRAKWEQTGVGEEHKWTQDRWWRVSTQHLPQTNTWQLPWGSYLSGLPRWHQRWRTHLPMQETQETWVWSQGQKDPLEDSVASHSSILAWRISWTEGLGRLQSMGSQRVGHNNSAQLTAELLITHFTGEKNRFSQVKSFAHLAISSWYMNQI